MSATPKRSRFRLVAVAVLAVAVIAAWGFYLSHRQKSWSIRIATATAGGTYHPVGTQLARILEKSGDDGRGRVTSAVVLETAGSGQNIELLTRARPRDGSEPRHEDDREARDGDVADIAFVQVSALDRATPEQRAELRALTKLFPDVVQIVVRADAGVDSLSDLGGKRVYVGKTGSGTRQIAEAVLAIAGLSKPGSVAREGEELTYEAAAESMIAGRIDVAIFAAAVPTDAVARLFGAIDVELLPFAPDAASIAREAGKFADVFESATIPAGVYPGQASDVRSVSVPVLLVGRKDLSDRLAHRIVRSIFDNVRELHLGHEAADEIRYQDTLRRGLDAIRGLELHSGARDYWEEQPLLLATGALSGEYYTKGRALSDFLQRGGFETRVIHTQGSFENIDLMRAGTPMLAIMQLDTALIAHLGRAESIYKVDVDDTVPRVRGMYGLAMFHEEVVHVVARRDDRPATLSRDRLRGLRVCLGPKRSGTRMLAKAILGRHDIDLETIDDVSLSVQEMVRRLTAGTIDVGFFVDEVPSQVLESVLSRDDMRLLSLDLNRAEQMVGLPALMSRQIPPGRYKCQAPDEPPVKTISTRSVLVTSGEVDDDVIDLLAHGLFSSKYLGHGVFPWEDMPIELHPAAVPAYQEAEHLATPRELNWQEWGALLTIFVIAVGSPRAALILRRSHLGKKCARRIFEIELAAPDSVKQLVDIRREIDRNVALSWWRNGEIDRSTWRSLNELIDIRIAEAKEDRTRGLLKAIRDLRRLNGDARRGRAAELEETIWGHLQNGELDEAQHGLLLKVLAELMTSDDEEEA